jgi:hypothetical protein
MASLLTFALKVRFDGSPKSPTDYTCRVFLLPTTVPPLVHKLALAVDIISDLQQKVGGKKFHFTAP